MFQKLKEENQKLLNKNLSFEKEIENLKFQVSVSALIISEHESKIEMLKAENKNLLKQINNTSKSSTEKIFLVILHHLKLFLMVIKQLQGKKQ